MFCYEESGSSELTVTYPMCKLATTTQCCNCVRDNELWLCEHEYD